ncbi:bifunctional polynucleotide phosphatase/kinase-like [Octopus sinensis]|uniref:Bifunctional polynucleotide phosphatase/kinase-like n=1 Tax=Octopus sinensis TaxID=2607531 RepID=A0A6P7U6G0_9MOLL|nr:bifunctional polynucleotide phosphatase/kinase-like [Octopus sinensis]
MSERVSLRSVEWSTFQHVNPRGQQEVVIYTTNTNSDYKKCPQSVKVAAFDIDWCLVRPKGMKKYPKDSLDWEWLFPCIPDTLSRLRLEGYEIVMFSNQKLAGRSPKHFFLFQKRTKNFLRFLESWTVLSPVSGVLYRKPSIRLWELYERLFHGGHHVDRVGSIFVGDAAGRKDDFACSDRQFAYNVGCGRISVLF